MAEIKNKTLLEFIGELASKQATPGGGSVAALMGAQSAALTSMVCNLTIGKPKYAKVDSEMKDLLGQSEALQVEFIDMIKADVDVFDKLMSAYSFPKNTDEEKIERSLQIQACLKQATLVPLACAKACSKAIQLSQLAAEKGNIGVISDAGVAAMAGYSGLKSAALNVYINTGSIKDKPFADEQLTALAQIMVESETMAQNVYQIVKEKL